ncbi:MAG TPA: tetratricopeptide repeat protein, partial [Candidatus Eisenbacteria bacterium]|nr:tetratricopeptide repeat protein [Candidatus Eisenbacteria bacterium]
MKVGERGIRLATYDEASTLLQRAREMLTSKEHVEQRLQIDLLRGDIEAIRGSYTKAAEIIEPVLEEVRAIGNLPLLAQTLGKLGRIAMWRQNLPLSMKYLEEAITISRNLGDESTLMFNLRQIGNALMEEEDGARSIHYLEESVAIARKLGDRVSEATGLNSLGNALMISRRLDESRDAYVRAIEAHTAVGDRFGAAMAMGNLGGLYVNQNDLDLGERYVQETLSVAKELRVPALIMDVQSTLAAIHLRRGRDREAHALLKEIVRAAREVGLPPKIYPLFHGVIRIRAGDRAKGLAWIGYSRAHSPKFEVKTLMRWVADTIRGNDSEEDLERALKAGEGLNLEEILEEAERLAP